MGHGHRGLAREGINGRGVRQRRAAHGRTQHPRTPVSPEPEGAQQPAARHNALWGTQGQSAAHPPPCHSHVQDHGGEHPPWAVIHDPGRRAGAAWPRRR